MFGWWENYTGNQTIMANPLWILKIGITSPKNDIFLPEDILHDDSLDINYFRASAGKYT